MQGWIKLHRKMTEWEWFQKSEMVHLFVHLLLMANHKPKPWQGIDIKRGQVVTGLKSLKKATGISTQTLRTCLSKLEKSGNLTSKSTNKYRIITLCNYETYQIAEAVDNKQTNKQLTINQQSTNKQLTPNNNVKNSNNVNNDNIYTLDQCQNEFFKQGLTDDDAEKFYNHYQSQGWKKGNGLPISDLSSQVTNWRLNPKQYEVKEDKDDFMRKVKQYDADRDTREGKGIMASVNTSRNITPDENIF
jgi:hypothetical protein